MTKAKSQLRAEAVERLKNSVGARFKPDAAVIAIVGGRVGLADWSLECDKLIDLLTDDCGPCYSCAKLAELMAENSALRVIVGGLKVPTDPGEASMMSVDAFVRKQTEHESLDSREKLEADVRRYANPSGGKGTLGACWEKQMIEFLNRQAAITEREFIDAECMKCAKADKERESDYFETLAERDDVIAVLKAENAELEVKVDRLTRENARLSSDEFYLRCTLVDMNGEAVG